MERLRIVAGGNSDQAKANARGKLFEKITAEVLRHSGYEIDKHSINANYAGMEIDIEGREPELPAYHSMLNANATTLTLVYRYYESWFSVVACRLSAACYLHDHRAKRRLPKCLFVCMSSLISYFSDEEVKT